MWEQSRVICAGAITLGWGGLLMLGALLVELFQRRGHAGDPALAVLDGLAQPFRRPGAVVGLGDDGAVPPGRRQLVNPPVVAAVTEVRLVLGT